MGVWNFCRDGSVGGLLERRALLRNESGQRLGERFAWTKCSTREREGAYLVVQKEVFLGKVRY